MNAGSDLQVSVETSAGLERRMTVSVPAAAIEREIETRLAKVSRTAKLRGFRPGKIPQKVVRQRFGSQVRDEVLTDVIRSTYSRAIEEHNLNPAGGPRIEPLSAEGADDRFSYRAVFEVYPEVELAELDTLELDLPKVTIEEADVDAMIEKLRLQRAEWRAVERKADANDRVVIDYDGTLDGEPFQGGSGRDVTLVVGAGQVIEDFDKGLRGVEAGEEKTIEVQFPQDYRAENLAGKKAEFAIKVHRVEERVLPEVDDEFCKAFGVTEGGVEALRTEVRSNMERELGERLRAAVKTRAFDALLKAHDVPLPSALVDQEVSTLQTEAMRQMNIEDPAAAPARENFVELGRRRVAIGLLIQELMRQHKIKLDRTRVERRVEELASPYENPAEAAQYYRSNRNLMAQVEAGVLEDQVVDFLLERVKKNERAVPFEEFMNS